MEICINFGGRRHCFFLPIFQIPIHWGKPGPGPVNYPALFQDSMILAAVADVAKQITDEHVRKSVEQGITAGFQAAQKHAGPDVSINPVARG
ncbi:hypothetical protein JQ594_17130 [Bradyrhizobium manausense]|uniref:hypothetical protein n=1 Tax=Bradyrhizobium manausense TaxID=989370 RepID=UPI001BAD90F9|nr:hypothetical protein [Bradyrhizobium manausense]MBR0687658.1 hypothetical protein [Bradyrhizobium manausense]